MTLNSYRIVRSPSRLATLWPIFLFSLMVQEMIRDGFLKKTGNKNKLPASRLPARQREILRLLAEGKNSREVAERLGISVKTV
jgi:DNA-binding NarL/FixJ family response regulator